MSAHDTLASKVDISLVIPVYNGSSTIGTVVDRIHQVFAGLHFNVVLVNDGSHDASEQVCHGLVERHPDTVSLVQLSRNFGEHNAVLAGLSHAPGKYIAVLDDDGQNPPDEVLHMYNEIRCKNYDVVYGRYEIKRHGLFRNIGSWFANRMATIMLKKPPELYLSSFKVMNRFTVNHVIRYRGAFPYVDGLIYRVTRNIGQITVEHRPRMHGRSNYTLTKLVLLWMNMFLNFSILPLRLVAITGLVSSFLSLLALAFIWCMKLQTGAALTPGFPTVLCSICFFGGLNLLVAGMVGEYLGRLYLDQTGSPQYIVRYVRRGRSERARRKEAETSLVDTDPQLSCSLTQAMRAIPERPEGDGTDGVRDRMMTRT